MVFKGGVQSIGNYLIRLVPKSCNFTFFSINLLNTVDPGNHQDYFHITPSFFSVWYGPHAHESRSKHLKVFPGADFEKNPFL